LRDVHGRDPVVPYQPAGLRRVGPTQLASKIDQIMLSSAEVAASAKFAPIAIAGGVLADEAMALFK